MIQYHERAPFECVWLNKNKTKQQKKHHKNDNEALMFNHCSVSLCPN